MRERANVYALVETGKIKMANPPSVGGDPTRPKNFQNFALNMGNLLYDPM
jgi:hypothetical protein